MSKINSAYIKGTNAIARATGIGADYVRLAIGLLIIIVVVSAGVGIYRWVTRRAGTTLGKIDAESSTGTKVTPGLNFDSLCDQLYLAGPRRWGTDEESIYGVLRQLNTQADYVYLGQKWAAYWSSLSWLERHNDTSWGYGNGSLGGMLQNELTKSELAQARSILTANGITPDF